ncbi:hypothetical protein [Actinokineospora enzanensis]|uniref:hypothetical protein n=1 Tax=Actinokineospora enzanensis TaxID=155975 RepID=UPI00036D5271|nr:hypothetical protein [Actinokineospora enzanensis]
MRRTTILLAASTVVILGLATALVLVLTIGSKPTPDPAAAQAPAVTSFTFRGWLHITDTSGISTTGDTGTGTSCEGRGGYKDVRRGAAVTVYSSTGEVLAVGELGASRFTGNALAGDCAITFGVTVPDGHDIYQVEVTHRGKVAVTAADARNGHANLTLG